MTQETKGPGKYVQKVHQETQAYIRELLEENEKLRLRAANLEGERTRLKEEKMSLQEQTLGLREQLERFQTEQRRLNEQLFSVEADNQHFSEKYVEVEEHNNNLANLYVASYRLHETVDRDEVLTALQEILINLIGSEEFAILERNTGTSEISVTTSFGVEPEVLAELDLQDGPVHQTMATGDMYLNEDINADPDLETEGLVACIPMKLGQSTHGAIAIFSLLSHKQGLEPLDYELFDLLASHAATSLFLSGLKSRIPGSADTEVGA
jgi:hypothetical protein